MPTKCRSQGLATQAQTPSKKPFVRQTAEKRIPAPPSLASLSHLPSQQESGAGQSLPAQPCLRLATDGAAALAAEVLYFRIEEMFGLLDLAFVVTEKIRWRQAE